MKLYGTADKFISMINRRILKVFDRLRLMKKDELNIIREVSEAYDSTAARARANYFEIAYEAYIVALIQAHKTNGEATSMAEQDISLDWVDEMLEETDFVTLYRFNNEKERKKQRLVEALAVPEQWNTEIDKATRYWSLQLGQYAINTVDRARLNAFRRAGIRKVKWNTEKDQRVCSTCHSLDGRVFDIEDAPPKQHFNCRCWYSPVFDD